MVLCKYFQQGNCRFGQYCRFEHVNNFAPPNTTARNKQYSDTKNIALMVAEDVLAAERGGQWLLSCFGPFKEQSCIPGMEDLSPEEVRWEMYQAQKNGMVDSAKIQFQQLCQATKAKRDALKNPTPEIVTMLENLQKGSHGATTFGSGSNAQVAKPNNFSFAAPQLGLPASGGGSGSAASSGGFATAGNPFSRTNPLLFGRTANASAAPAFGGKPTFSGSTVFGNPIGTVSPFGGAAKGSSSTAFGGAQNARPFGSVTQPNVSAFGGSSAQPVFGQPTAFDTSTQASTGPFSRAQPALSTNTVFGGGTTPSASLFGGTAASQSANSLFGGVQTSGASLFGSTAASPNIDAGIFGSAPSSSVTSPTVSASPFGQSKTTAFGGAPVFGGTPNFGATPGASLFGGAPTASSHIFGGTAGNATTPSFSPVGQTSVSTSGALPFGSGTSPTTPFSQTAPFGSAVVSIASVPVAFGTATSTTSLAGTANASVPFGAPPFGSAANSQFASSDTPATATTTNPFAPKVQQGNSPFGFVTITAKPIFDDSAAYTAQDHLTDDEKSMYLAQQFIFGKIPIKPPTKELR